MLFLNIVLIHQSIVAIGPGSINHNASYNPNEIELAKPVEIAQAILAAVRCSGPVTSNPVGFWMDQQDHNGSARGYAPFLVPLLSTVIYNYD